MTARTPRTWGIVALATGLVLACGALSSPAAAQPEVPDPTLAAAGGIYVVSLDAPPTALHRATRPEAGERFDRTRGAVRAYAERLRADQDRVLAAIDQPTTLYRYTTAVNGFAAELDEDQVKQLRQMDGVALVERSATRRTTRDTGHFLGLEDVWREHGGAESAGKGMVVGVVDTGIWPENPSFAGLPQQTPGTSPDLPGFHGACAEAEEWGPRDCNDKVVSARWFARGFGTDNLASSELLSARDNTGHGSHVASTAAGEHNVHVEIDGQGFGPESGMAPAARIAAYKACWTAPDPADDGCTTADTVAAIDRAVADGVDVLNYSVAGSTDPADTVSRAFLTATAAGVFVAASAGNDGPGTGTVGHAAPWVTTVGASTHRLYQGAVRTGDGASYVGAMTSERTIPLTLVVLAGDAAIDPTAKDAARRCEPGALDASVVQDKVVVCDRGLIPRVEKSTAVSRAGGVGMVLANTDADSVDADVHAVPTVHLDATDAQEVKAYVRDRGSAATLSLDPTGAEDVDVPAIAPFSGRGPLTAGGLLKPDLVAPGTGVVGAVSPPSNSGRLWDLRSGSSVSTPHVAGLAAFVQGLHPTWGPARIKSAMMTTAYQLEGSAGPFAQGAGHIDPSRFLDPGLVLDEGTRAWRDFVGGKVRASELNVPSVAVGALVGNTLVTRRVTSVASTTETYSANVTGLDDLEVTVLPSTLTLAPGESRRVRIRLRATPQTSAESYAKGALTWTGLSHQVRLPVVVRSAAVAAPGELDGTGGSGQVVVRGRSGRGEGVDLSTTGLVPAYPIGLTLRPGPFDADDPRVDGDTFGTDIGVPEGTEAARFELESHNLADDVDVYLYRDGELVSSSTRPTADATVTLLDPEPGDYRLYVHAVNAGNGAATTSQLTTWVVGEEGGSALELSVGATATAPGDRFEYTASWEDLDPTQRWFGVVRYADSERRTLLRVN